MEFSYMIMALAMMETYKDNDGAAVGCVLMAIGCEMIHMAMR